MILHIIIEYPITIRVYKFNATATAAVCGDHLDSRLYNIFFFVVSQYEIEVKQFNL
jgi:hypothetical protein